MATDAATDTPAAGPGVPAARPGVPAARPGVQAAGPGVPSAGPGVPAAGPGVPAAGPGIPGARAYPDLGAALIATIPADARVVGFGEIHARTDRAPVTSSLASFTRALPAIADKLSDLVLETWLVDPACGKAAVQTTAKIETTMKRPEATKSEIAEIAAAARAAHIQPHAMTLICADYAMVVPRPRPRPRPRPAGSGAPQRDVDPVAMLTLTTRELTRIATSAVIHRDKEPQHRPWIAVYGGALHNDRFPDPTVAEWSYAAAVDRVTGGRFVEIDIIVPELAAADPVMQAQPWFPLVAAPRDPARPVVVWQRGERSFVVILPPASPSP
jgi:hypothetical protein